MSDQMLDSFLAELEKVEEDKQSNEGDAHRYFEHAIVLKSTIKFLRYNLDLSVYSGGGGCASSQQLTRSTSSKLAPVDENESTRVNNEQQQQNNEMKITTQTEETAEEMKEDEDTTRCGGHEPMGVDLLRCESLASLDEESRQRVLAKNYSVLISMAPYNSSGEPDNSPPVTADAPFHVGPALPEFNSPWFKLFIYDLIASGPPTLLIPKGTFSHTS